MSPEFCPRGLDQSGLKPHMFSGTKEFGVGKDLSRLRKLMPQLRAIGRKVMESSDDEETGQPRIGEAW